MIRNIVFIMLIGFCLGNGPLLGNDDWILKTDSNGIKVYLRSVKNSDIKEFKAVMRVKDVTLSSIIAVFEDMNAYTDWVYQCKEAKVLKRIDKYRQINYVSTDFPVGISDRDVVNYSMIKQDPKSLAIKISFKALPDYSEKINGIIRMEKADGYYLLKPLQDGSIKIVYQLHAEPGGRLMSWMVNSNIHRTPFNTFTALRKMLKKEKYKNAIIDYIKNRKK